MDDPPSEIPVELLDAAVELIGRAGRRAGIPVQGTSMLPTLRPGQLLAVEFAPDGLRQGDVLLFRQNEELVVHRLLGRARTPAGDPSLRTRGDGLNRLDPHLDPGKVVGRALAVRDEGGWWDLRSASARRYGRMLAWHDLFWSAIGSLARALDRLLRRSGRMPRAIRDVDRWLLRRVHSLLFRRLHGRTRVEGLGGDDEGTDG